MTIAQYISDFLRDAQYRIGQLTVEIDKRRDDGDDDPNFIIIKQKRSALIRFMRLCYDPYHLFIDNGYNLLSAGEAWTEREIAAEIEFLRDYTDMVRIPYAVFTGYYPTIVNYILGDSYAPGSDTNLPKGDYLEILRYNSSGQLEAIPYPQYAGMGSLPINDYFAGRI